MTDPRYGDLKALGESAAANKELYQYDAPDPSILEKFPNPRRGTEHLRVNIEAPEFTSLCPLTGQPDFATIKIEYRPLEWCVESKSLKLYLGGFRNYGAFHEDCCDLICTHIVECIDPDWVQVVGDFAPRGGISFVPTVTYSKRGLAS